MIATEPIEDFLVTVLWTSKIENANPLSVILHAPSAGGKSSIIRKLQGHRFECPITRLHTDLTTREISKAVRERDIHFILLSDLQAVFAHKNTVISMTVQALRNLTAEGIYNDPFSGERVEKKLGFIAGVPTDTLNDDGYRKLTFFTRGDMASRFIQVKYEYKRATLLKIHDSIEHDTPDTPLKDLPEDADLIKVHMSEDIAKKVRKLSDSLRGRGDVGTRIHHQLRTLTRAYAVRCGREKTEEKDYDYVASFSDFVKGDERVI